MQLQAGASSVMASIANPAGAVAVLCFVILVHESGHYLAARTFGMKVEEFSIGVGPKLFGMNAFGNDFNLRALPLGGYVRFPENYNQTLAQEAEERAMFEESKTESSLQRNLTNFLTLGGYEQSLQDYETRLEEERKEELRKTPFWKKLFGGGKKSTEAEKPSPSTSGDNNNPIEYYDDPDLLQNRPWPERAVVIAGGVIFNFILAFMIYFGEITVGSGLSKPVFDQGAMVNSIPTANAAAAGLLTRGDVILRVNGEPLSRTESPNSAASQKAIGEFIAKIRETPEGEALELSVLKQGGAEKKVQVVPRRTNGPQAPPSIGVMLGPNFSKMNIIKSSSLPEATKLAAQSLSEITSQTTTGILSVLGGMVQGKGGGGAQLSGPVGLIQTGSEIVSTKEGATVLVFAAAISVNLAVVNSLPLPALDGGQMVFILAEALMGRKVDQRFQENVTSAAVLLLFLLTISTTVGDVQNLFK